MIRKNKLIQDVKDWCEDNDCYLVLLSSDYIADGDSKYSGIFDPSTREIVVATGKPFKKWMTILIHEWCHAQQFIDNSEWFMKKVSSISKFFEALENGCVDKVKTSIVKDCIDLEVDCEKMVYEYLKKHEVNTELDTYIQRANAYVMVYWYIHRVYGKWVGGRLATYSNKSCWSKFPNKFLRSYSLKACTPHMESYHHLLIKS